MKGGRLNNIISMSACNNIYTVIVYGIVTLDVSEPPKVELNSVKPTT